MDRPELDGPENRNHIQIGDDHQQRKRIMTSMCRSGITVCVMVFLVGPPSFSKFMMSQIAGNQHIG
jgi:hypothetical protein